MNIFLFKQKALHILKIVMLRAKTILTFIVALLLSTSVGAEPSTESKNSTQMLLKMAQAAYDDIEYEECLELLKEAEQKEDITSQEKVFIYALRGKALAIIGENTAAYDAFWLLLQHHPDYAMNPRESPKISEVFKNVQTQVQNLINQQSIKIIPQAEQTYTLGQPMILPFQLAGHVKNVARFVFYFRYQGQTSFQKLAIQPLSAKEWQGLFPQHPTQKPGTYVVEYYVELYGQAQAPIKTLGSSISPQTMHLHMLAPEPHAISPTKISEEPGPQAFYTKSWFWWTSAILAGTATTFYILNNQNQAPNTPLGEIPMD